MTNEFTMGVDVQRDGLAIGVVPGPLRLDLGACGRRIPSFLSVDIFPPADIIQDLSVPWEAIVDSSVEEIRASHIIEHLPNRILTMNQIHRVLVPGGRVVIDVPDASRGAGHIQDPTHQGPGWCMNSFTYFDDRDHNWQKFHERQGVTAKLRVIEWSEKLEGKNVHKYQDVWVLHVVLEAVK